MGRFKIILTIIFIFALGTIVSVFSFQNFKTPIDNFLLQNQSSILSNFVKILQSDNIVDQTQQVNNLVAENLNNYNKQITNNINEFFETNNPKLCEYSYDNNGSVVQGKLYLYNQKILNTNSYTKNNVIKSNNYLIDGNYLYTWGNDVISIKINITPFINSDQNKKFSEGFDLKQLGIDKGLNFICQNWEVDENVFKIPSDINFIDLKQNLQKVTDQINITSETMINAKNKVCEACDLSPTEILINECKKALNCK